MGFNAVSFYTDWALLEGKPGRVVTDGIWDLNPFFSAAAEAGIYLVARPGPYINAEVSAGGFPGWSLRINCTLRTACPSYLDATQAYISTIVRIMADAEITNGGPVILVQPENEYTTFSGVDPSTFPQQSQKAYMAAVEQQFRDAGVTVPFIDNDNLVHGDFAPGSGLGAIDIYAIDAYPLRYDCANPSVWPNIRWPQNWQILHEQQSPSTPFAIAEFQGGSGTSFEGVNQDMCNALVNQEAARVVYKNNYSFGVKLFNIYMTWGGTNWGNLGYEGGDTSYDYGAAITEDRHVWREKYSEEKLQANFFKVSPAYLTATPGNAANGSFGVTNDIAVTPLYGNGTATNFYVVRHADWTSQVTALYTLLLSTTTASNVSIPQLGGALSLEGRDSKIHVTDYSLGPVNLTYTTAEIFTWATSPANKTILILYGGLGETHEFAFPESLVLSNGASYPSIKHGVLNHNTIVQWKVETNAQVLCFNEGEVVVHLLWRNDAYNLWSLELPSSAPIGNYSSPSKDFVVVRAGYLLRSASLEGNTLHLVGDVNCTTNVQVLFEPTGNVDSLTFNGEVLHSNNSDAASNSSVFTIPFRSLPVELPDFSTKQWKYIDSLPEITADYDDALWTLCDHSTTTNPVLQLLTPTSLYASDYGFHTGSLLYRGHFEANDMESTLFLNISGGYAFAHSVWLNDQFLGSWTGSNANQTYAQTFTLPTQMLRNGQDSTFTVLIDHMGQTEAGPGNEQIKFPLGILDFGLAGHNQSDVTWKMTGNFGGEDYHDLARGPRNEGAMYAERQGFHLPAPPDSNWTVRSPISDGIVGAGIGFFTTSFNLSMPQGYDTPLSFVFPSAGASATRNFRIQLFVNGYQFGKYVSNLGPETTFPVPEGILNHSGENWLAITLWSLDSEGAELDSFKLEAMMPVFSGYAKPALSPQPAWSLRTHAY
ncbi:MAG: hypothetical protein Q9159_007606 [Coniocarpon cinnabarinum]